MGSRGEALTDVWRGLGRKFPGVSLAQTRSAIKNRTVERLPGALILMGNITILLGEIRSGNDQARSDLFAQVYGELTRLARIRLAGGESGMLDAPSLVHEAYLKLSEQEIPTLKDRRDFFAYSAAVMRNVVIDLVRRQNAEKRGSGRTHLTLSSVDAQSPAQPLDAESLHAALEHLERIDSRAYRIVEMRYFAGLSIEEVAAVLDLSPMTVKRSWQSARAFLFNQLRE